jgi:hypothetical protein
MYPHLGVLENFYPMLITDPFHWTPKGLMEDLMDNTAEPFQSGVNDQVSGHTIQQIFAALQPDVASLGQYKTRLLTQNPSNPNNGGINNLFESCGY